MSSNKAAEAERQPEARQHPELFCSSYWWPQVKIAAYAMIFRYSSKIISSVDKFDQNVPPSAKCVFCAFAQPPIPGQS